MKTEIYTEKQLTDTHRCCRRYLFFSIAFPLAAFAVAIGLCFAVSDTNATVLKIVNICLTSLGGCCTVRLMWRGVLPARARIRFLARMLAAPRHTLRGMVCRIDGMVTVTRDVAAAAVHFTTEQGRDMVLYLDMQYPFPLPKKQMMVVEAVQNVIVAYDEVSL